MHLDVVNMKVLLFDGQALKELRGRSCSAGLDF